MEHCEHGGKTARSLQFSQLVTVSTAGLGEGGPGGGVDAQTGELFGEPVEASAAQSPPGAAVAQVIPALWRRVGSALDVQPSPLAAAPKSGPSPSGSRPAAAGWDRVNAFIGWRDSSARG